MSQADHLRLRNNFLAVRQQVLAKFDWLPRVKLEQCYVAEQDHKKEGRVFAHWGDKTNTICYAKDLEKLPDANQLGIILHEFGHVVDDFLDDVIDEHPEYEEILDIEDAEIRADYIVAVIFEAELSYDKDDVQFLKASAKKKAAAN